MERGEFEGQVSGSGSRHAVVGWLKEQWGIEPTAYSEMRIRVDGVSTAGPVSFRWTSRLSGIRSR